MSCSGRDGTGGGLAEDHSTARVSRQIFFNNKKIDCLVQGSEKAKVMAKETQVADLQAVARNLARDLEKSKEENLAFVQVNGTGGGIAEVHSSCNDITIIGCWLYQHWDCDEHFSVKV